PDFTGDITEALRQERKIELYMEESRWFDIRRWKILQEALGIINYGISITEVKDLDAGTLTTKWKRIECQARNMTVFNDKIYWIPIATTELKKAPQLVQNPGY
ncbi:MAG: RagB/SusD family nutrient uptake outer membrane protein, partial [Bacteroidales bacterium]|nr:RagB/SusD family nutrient uptake outer membrane protein [Bacteroidales bacterium]